MAAAVKIEIVSPERLMLSEEAESVTIPGTDGYFTVVGDHAPMMSTLKPGFITVRSGETKTFFVRGGFVDVSVDGVVTVLSEETRPAADLDRSEIETWIREAEENVAKQPDIDHQMAAQHVVDQWKNLLLEAQDVAHA